MAGESAVRIALMLPDVLGTYGDNGNVLVLQQRLRWRGLGSEQVVVRADDPIPSDCDIYVLGGGEDRAQTWAAEYLLGDRGLVRAVERGASVLAVCAGLQILGTRFAGSDGHPHTGLGLLDLETRGRDRRAVGEIVVDPGPGLDLPVLTGFENHQGATTLGPEARPLGRVRRGIGNGDGSEGVVAGRIVGTYLHGPVLARNPALADLLLTRAVGTALPDLPLPVVEALRRDRLRAATPS